MLINFIGFQAPVTPIMEGIIDLHNYIFVFLIGILVFVLVAFIYIMIYYYIIPTYLYSLDMELDRKLNEVSFFTGKEEFYKSKGRFLSYFYKLFDSLVLSYQKFIILVRTTFLVKNLNEDYTYYRLLALYQLRFEIIETRKIIHGTIIEIVWTIIPSVILLFIAVPSFALLYSMDEIIDPKLTVKAIGYQWFWSYEYGQEYDEVVFDYFTDGLGYNYKYSREALVYDSVLIPDTELVPGFHRLLDVDHQLILPINTHIRLIITAADVLHSWAVPVLGIKLDAIPGRLSQIGLFIKREGIYYGQCSELCGVNHGFMPIAVKAIGVEKFLNWYHSTTVEWQNVDSASSTVVNKGIDTNSSQGNFVFMEYSIALRYPLHSDLEAVRFLKFSNPTRRTSSFFIDSVLNDTVNINDLKLKYNYCVNRDTSIRELLLDYFYSEIERFTDEHSYKMLKKIKKLLSLLNDDFDVEYLQKLNKILNYIEKEIYEINETTNEIILEQRPPMRHKMIRKFKSDAIELEFLRNGHRSNASYTDPVAYERDYLRFERNMTDASIAFKPRDAFNRPIK